METHKAVSLFTGAGGLDLGFEQAGFKTVWANELNRDACATFERHHGPNIMRCGDLHGFLPELGCVAPPEPAVRVAGGAELAQDRCRCGRNAGYS